MGQPQKGNKPRKGRREARYVSNGLPSFFRLGTGGDVKIAHQTVIHTQAQPSHIVLPIVE